MEPARRLVLLIEDSKADVYLIRQAIHTAQVDADVQVIYDGQAATQFIDAADRDANAPCPDLILLDLNLPKKTGADVLQRLRTSTRFGDTRVLVVTSSESRRDREAVAAYTVSGYFRKPSEHGEFMKLGDLIKRTLESS